jgi:hypothetical protein
MEDRPARRRTFLAMGSRLLPFLLVAAALLADGGGAHRAAYYLVLLAVPAAAAAAFVGVADVLEGKPALGRAITATLSLLLLLVGCAARAGAAEGAAVPAIAVSAAVAAAVVYAVPLVGWLFEPVRPRRRAPQRARRAAPPARAELRSQRSAEAA